MCRKWAGSWRVGLNTITILGRVILFTVDCKGGGGGTEIHCLTLLACFFLPSFSSLIKTIMYLGNDVQHVSQ